MFERLKEWIFGKSKEENKEPKKFDGYLGRRKIMKVGHSKAII